MSTLVLSLAILGGVAGNLVLVAGVIIPTVRWLDRRLDHRITLPVLALDTKLEDRFNSLDKKVDAVALTQTDQGRQIVSLRERTAGLESAVFKRPPLSEEGSS